MNEIIITEEQAKIIDIEILSCSSKAFRVVNISKKVDLDLVTIAQIVEGAPYEVKYEFKVGDIVKGVNTGRVKIVSDFSDDYHVSKKLCDESGKFKLVCKVEDRHDLKGVSE
jgi:hypothetical protein